MSARVKTALRRMQAQRFPSDELLGERPFAEPAWQRTQLNADGDAGRLPARRPIRRRVALAGLAAAAAATALAVPSLLGGSAYAATPPMLTYYPAAATTTAQQTLTGLAARARVQPQPAGSGRYHYVHTRGWYLHGSSDINTGKILSSGIAAVDREQWIANDGSGRLRVSDGTSMAPNGTYPPGGLSGNFVPETATATTLQALAKDHTAAGWIKAISDLWRRQVAPPAVHSTLLTILAEQPGLTLMGTTTDRAGRPGIAISAVDHHGSDTRRVLVFNPDTGGLLDSETIVLKNSDLPVHAPATIDYTVWLAVGYTPTTEQRPAT